MTAYERVTALVRKYERDTRPDVPREEILELLRGALLEDQAGRQPQTDVTITTKITTRLYE